jgi:hypothetical protein
VNTAVADIGKRRRLRAALRVPLKNFEIRAINRLSRLVILSRGNLPSAPGFYLDLLSGTTQAGRAAETNKSAMNVSS